VVRLGDVVGLTRMPGRLLVVSNTPFLPATAGNRERIRQMVSWLARRGWEVSVLLLPDADVETWDVAGMERTVARVEVARPPARGLLARVTSHLRGGEAPADSGAPIGVDDWCPDWFRARVRAVVRAARPDVALVEYVFLSACLDDLPTPRPLAVIDTHDVMHRRRATYATAGVPLRWFHTTRAEEARGLARADVVLAISDEEATVLREMAPEVLTVPHARDVAPAPLDAGVAGRVLYVASHNDLNVAAYEWLVTNVWPALRAAVPAAELVVCGTIGEKLGPPPAGVVVRGAVESLAAEYARARVVVNPAPSGTGLPVKTVEALCHGRPVVATPAGAGGIAGGVTTESDASRFAEAVVRLLTDTGEWRRLAADAATTARARFSPEAAFAALERRMGSAVRAR
jgi:glycosyltransferase involved in cell wall biosynthesis